jgi:hypothetical protein
MNNLVKLGLAATGLVATAIVLFFLFRDKDMTAIKFDLKANIVETARKSGVPEYSTANVDGYISYSVNDIPADVPARYVRDGYEVSFSPLFALTMYADEKNQNNLGVENVTLQFSTKPFASHEAGKQFAEGVIAEMNKKKWVRYIDEFCPAVSGRSSFMNADGKLEQIGTCPLDPAYALTREEWIHMMRTEQSYQWLGDGVLASFKIAYSEDSRGITYNFFMEFDDLAVKKRKIEQRLQASLKEEDQKGWKSTEKHQKYLASRHQLIQLLEANAVKRGDHVVNR